MSFRKDLRVATRLQCQVVREQGFREIANVALDLSHHGLRAETNAQVMTGEEVIVSIRNPLTGRFVDATGHVARIIHGRRDGDRTRALGIEFDSLDATSRAQLESMLMRFAA